MKSTFDKFHIESPETEAKFRERYEVLTNTLDQKVTPLQQAAGFSHPGSVKEIRDFIVAEVDEQLSESAA